MKYGAICYFDGFIDAIEEFEIDVLYTFGPFNCPKA
jgi:hypothetical protein